MTFELHRIYRRPDGIFSTWSGPNYSGVSIEHAYQQSDGSWQPKLVNGTYTIRRRFSPHFQCDVFEILNVPGCTFVEIHPGNKDADSEGCDCPGDCILKGAPWMVTKSREKFAEFMAILEGQNEAQLVVTG